MAKTLIFDLGGVLMAHDIPGCTERFRKLLGDNFSKLGLGTNGEGELLMKKYELGVIDSGEFINTVLSLCIPGTSAGDVKEAWNSMHAGIQPLWIETLNALKSIDFKMGLLSNINELHWQHVLDNYEGFNEIFDFTLLSFREHLAKPDRKFFEKAQEAAEAQGQDIIFIDDLAENRAAARALRWKTFASIEDLVQNI